MEKYVKLKQIGEGSFGKAVLVKCKENGVQYVVKEISISKMKPKERQEARKEVSVLSKMRHPNIVHYIESFEESGCLYIVMEYCEGGDLYARINAQRGMAFSEPKVLDWFVQMCLALKHVHDRKILHRDIKTSNIFLTKTGTIKLGDFGIARVLNNTMELARTCIGTPYYLSPEICENKPYNNKSDMWALGCVLYEVLTLKHAFEAGNMKNLVLKIIRGSYPPVPSRYSYDLRGLVGQLFRRNPRDRPSVNTILRQPFIRRHTDKFLTPEQHEDEFSHTVLHRNRKPPSARPASAVSAYRKADSRPRPSAKSPTDARSKQIAGIYGQPIAQRPRSAADKYRKYGEQKKIEAERKNRLLEAERRRKAENERKRKEELAMLQMERHNRIRAEQIKRARDQALQINLKRSADLFEPKKEADENKKPAENRPHIPAKLPRPTSAPSKPQAQKYAKYHDYLDKLRQGDKNGAVEVAAPKLAQVKEAWNERVSAQNAVMEAIGNKVEAKYAANHARVLNDYWDRKMEAANNKQQGQIIMHGGGQGVARALQPYSVVPEPRPGPDAAKNRDESEYLARLRQIRIQNFNERRALREKMKGKPYQVVGADQDAVKRKKEEALQKQARERAELIRQDVERRKQVMNVKPINGKENVEISYQEKARVRQILPPDERPVNYTPNPIGITQALHAVGGVPEVAKPAPSEPVANGPAKPSQPAVKPEVRKNILKRLNEKFMSNDEDKEETKSEDPSKPAVRQAWGSDNNEPKANRQWAAGDIGLKIAAMPLEETASQMEATNYEDVAIMNEAKKIVAKRGWNQPSNTVVNKLNLMSICDPTLTMATEDTELKKDSPKDTDRVTESENVNNNNPKSVPAESGVPTSSKSGGARPLPPVPARSQSPVKFTVNLESAKKAKPQSFITYLKEVKKLSAPPNKGTVVLGDISAATLDDTPEVESEVSAPQAPKQSVVAALAAKFDAGKANQKGTFVVTEKASQNVTDRNNENEFPKSENVSEAENVCAKIFPQEKTFSKEHLPQKHEHSQPQKQKIDSFEVIMPKETAEGATESDVTEIHMDDGNKAVAKADRITPQAWVKSECKEGQDQETKPTVPRKPPSLKQIPSPGSSSDKSPDKSPLPSPKKQLSPTCSLQTPKSPTKSQKSPSASCKFSPKMSAEEPMFSKVLHTPGTPSTLPITNQKTPTSLQKLNKTMFATASEEMVLKMTLGHFDSPNPKLLRTCSLPDLTKVIPEEDEGNGLLERSVRKSAENLKVESNGSSRSDTPTTPPPSPTMGALMASVASSMNDTNFDEEEELIPGSSQEDGAYLEEDEDFASLRANLQNVLLKDDDPGFSSDDEDGSKDDGWESDNDSSTTTSDRETDDVSDAESVFSRLEGNRVKLEAELGFEEFMKAYKYVQAIHEDEEEEMKVGERRIRALLGEKHDRLYPRILQLVMADGAYCEDNN